MMKSIWGDRGPVIRPKSLVKGARFRLNRALFQVQARWILSTPPVRGDSQPLVTMTLVSHRDMLQYLCAIKSFRRFVPFGRILVLDDGTLTDQDKAVLDHHLANPEIVHAGTISPGTLPDRLFWRRLGCALDRSEHEYVIQLDSDTLTMTDVSEVQQAVERNRCFTLNSNSKMGKAVFSMAAVSEKVKTYVATTNHVQALAESRLDEIDGHEALRYTRGNAGFAGFALGACNRGLVERVSSELEALLGSPKWNEWGSDMVGSNIAIANTPDPVVLPWPRYASWNPRTVPAEGSAFIHFIGTHRYEKGLYSKRARALCASLTAQAP
jgi:hypothetical protein